MEVASNVFLILGFILKRSISFLTNQKAFYKPRAQIITLKLVKPLLINKKKTEKTKDPTGKPQKKFYRDYFPYFIAYFSVIFSLIRLIKSLIDGYNFSSKTSTIFIRLNSRAQP